ncbi:MAG: AmpG family muropeptide MFS transporter [Scytolyngbya sp. HA4215-MV1]|nr:AmpG family muropeptide MFS transporter [Scytolyngbya sp. HA4215-MV1]
MLVILLLGFSSGLPFALTDDAFRGWMSDAQLDLRTIGWLSLVSLPYSLKFLWSPFLDRFIPPFLGRRRGWMAIAQGGLVAGILALSLQMAVVSALPAAQRFGALQVLACLAMGVTFLSATQDIAIDAYRADILTKQEVGAGAALAIQGFRLALLLTGGVTFKLADRLGWQQTYALISLLMAIGFLTSIWAPEPKQVTPPGSLKQAVILPFKEFFQRLGNNQAFLALIFVILFRVGDAMVAKMTVPFLGAKGLTFSNDDIGTVRQIWGVFATIFGTLAGGAVLSKIGINRSLWVFGILQAVSNLGYLALAIVGKNYPFMVIAVNIENFCSGLGTAGFVGFLISLCNPRFSATQFALLSSLMAVGRDLIAAPGAGELAQRCQQRFQTTPPTAWASFLAASQQQGWAVFFLLTLVVALPGLLLLPLFAPWNREAQFAAELHENQPENLDEDQPDQL